MVVSVATHSPVAAAPHEHEGIVQMAQLLELSEGQEVRLVGADGRCIVLPETARRLLRDLVQSLARDEAVAVIPVQRQLTPGMAAAILNVSEAYLFRLLDEGAIPSSSNGEQRRIRFDDLMAYKAQRDAERRKALAEMTRLSQELGLYDLEQEDHG